MLSKPLQSTPSGRAFPSLDVALLSPIFSFWMMFSYLVKHFFKKARIIIDILETFCSFFGQKINSDKSRLFVSNNTPYRSARQIYKQFPIPLATDLGLYWGIPLIHNHLTTDHYNFLFSKFLKKFIGWKKYSLSMVGRGVLVKAVLIALPRYRLQLAWLPKTVLLRLECLICEFFWLNSSKCNPIAWETLYFEQLDGGLSFSTLSSINTTNLIKLGWRFLLNPQSLWVQTLSEKYGDFSSISYTYRPQLSSATWRSLNEVSQFLSQRKGWHIGNGRQIRFWVDIWLLDCPLHLVSSCMVPLDIFFFCPAASFFEHQASQDFDLLGQFLPADILQCLSLAILDGAIDDLPIWCLHSNGTSASKSTKVLFPMLPAQEAGQWQNLWRVKVPPRISFLLWQAHHECLKGVSSTQSDYTVDSL